MIRLDGLFAEGTVSDMTNGKWFYEDQTGHIRIGVQIHKLLHEETSRFQNIKIFDTVQLGRMLVLDGNIQTTEADEFAYHEMLSHVPLHAHPNPESVLIVGGGDGGMVREVSKHDSVKRIVLVEIDEAVVRASIDHLPAISAALVDNPKLEIVIGDAIEFVKKAEDDFDVIIVDSSDPMGFAEGLFSHDFYRSVYNALRAEGIVTIQGESPWLDFRPLVKRIYGYFTDIFPIVKTYWANIPTYPSGVMVFPAGSKAYDPAAPLRPAIPGLKYYSPEIHKASFVLPRHLQPEHI
jgi:spermidine synthase